MNQLILKLKDSPKRLIPKLEYEESSAKLDRPEELTLLDILPFELIENILSYISYDEVSRCRLVSTAFNTIAKKVLNCGFHKVERYHALCLQRVKAQLPRRESERRKHPLARHSDILTAVETRLSLLGMTFSKYIDWGVCCFIPGKVLDEIFRVLRYVSNESSPIRAHEVLQELRDLSSMAMEHFDEKIAPAFKTGNLVAVYAGKCHLLKPNIHHNKYSKIFSKIQYLNTKFNDANREITTINQKLSDVNRKNQELEIKLAEQQALMESQIEKMKEQDLRLNMMSRQVMECDIIISPLCKDPPFVVEQSEKTLASLKRQSIAEEIVASQKRKLRPRATTSSENGDNLSKKIKK